MVARAGRGALLNQFDAADTYKQLQVQVENLNEQVFVADSMFYVVYCACFGSMYGNDSYSAFGCAHCICLAKAANIPSLKVFVDNYFWVTAFLRDSATTLAIAVEERKRLEPELKASGLRCHQWQGPVTQMIYLGCFFDTLKMTVAIPTERLCYFIDYNLIFHSWSRINI